MPRHAPAGGAPRVLRLPCGSSIAWVPLPIPSMCSWPGEGRAQQAAVPMA